MSYTENTATENATYTAWQRTQSSKPSSKEPHTCKGSGFHDPLLAAHCRGGNMTPDTFNGRVEGTGADLIPVSAAGEF
jgi:hypothetical protein